MKRLLLLFKKLRNKLKFIQIPFVLKHISRAQAAAAAAKAAFVAVQQQHLNHGGIGPIYDPEIPLYREANTLLAAAGVTNSVGPIPTAVTNNSIATDYNADVNLMTGANISLSSLDGPSPLLAMNLTTNSKGSREKCSVKEQPENFGHSQANDSNIDLTLPITSTYLRRIKALGFPTRYRNLSAEDNSLFHVSKLVILTIQ